MIALLLAAALVGAPAQRIEAETLRPGTVVRDAGASGGAALELSSRGLRLSLQGARIRILVRAPRCDGVLRVGDRRHRVARGRWRSVVVSGGTLRLRRGRCGVRVDRLDVLWAPAPPDTWQGELTRPPAPSVAAGGYDIAPFYTPPRGVARPRPPGAP